MPVKVTVTKISGISIIPGDSAPEGDPAWLPSLYNAVAMEFDIKFEYLEDPDTAPILSVNLASISPAVEGITFTKVGTDTIKVKGTPVNVFTDEIFRFLFNYNFAVKYDDNPAAAVPIVGDTVTATLSQNVAWLFDPSLAYFQDLVKRGKV